MNDILKNELCTYLGELTYDYQKEHDFMLKDKIAEKINAVNLLLGFEEKKETWYEKIDNNLKK